MRERLLASGGNFVKERKILHVIPAEKFTVDYVKRIQALFNNNSHTFLIYGEIRHEYRIEEIACSPMVHIVTTLFSKRTLVKNLIERSAMVVYHSLFLKIQDLLLMYFLTKRGQLCSCWSIWGKDLYEDFDEVKKSHGFIQI